MRGRLAAVLAVWVAAAWVAASPGGARVTGRVLDEGGVPVPDASVELFGNAGVWLDGKPGCAVSLLACDDPDAGDEVLRRLDAGTLEFPAPLATTSTDADGRFVLTDVADDTFVVARTRRAAVSRVVKGRLVEQLQFGEDVSQIDVLGARAPVMVISPFTHRSGVVTPDELGAARLGGVLPRFTWAKGLVDGGVSSVLVPGARPRQLSVGQPKRFALAFDGGVARTGHVRLACAGFSREAEVDGGVAVFEGVMGRCRASGLVGGDLLVDRLQQLDTSRGAGVARVSRRATLEVTVDGAPLRAGGEVYVGPKASLGLGGLGDAAGSARLEGNVARVENLPLGVSELVVMGEGVVAVVQPVTLAAGLNRVRVTLSPAVRLEGVLLDERERPIAEALVRSERSAVAGRLGEAKTDATGRFALELGDDAPVLLGIDHPTRGTLAVVARPREPNRIVFRPARELLVRAQFDGGVVAAVVRAAPRPEGVPMVMYAPEAPELARPLAVDDAGVARWAGIWPGECLVSVEAAGFTRTRRIVVVPDAGTVEATFALEPAAVLQGAVVRRGRPVPGLTVQLQDRADLGGGPIVTTNAEGRFRFEGLTPGRQRVLVFGDRQLGFDLQAPTLDARVELPF